MPITSLVNAKNAYPTMLKAIAQAKKSVYFANYWSQPGDCFASFVNELCAAAKRNVTVYVILDAHGSRSLPQSYIRQLRAAGVQAIWFQPFSWRNVSSYNKRNHKKILVIDDVTGFTGGMGIDDQWIAPSTQFPLARRDTHFKITGARVAELTASFATSWNRYAPIDTHVTGGAPEQDIEAQFMSQITSARHEINLTTAYFAPNKRIRATLIAAAHRGVVIRILTNGPYTTHWYAQRAGAHMYGSLLKNHIHIYEYQPTMIHTKILTVDRATSLIGSANCNFRSMRHDTDFNMVVNDTALTSELNRQFELDLAKSRENTLAIWNRRSVKTRLTQAITAIARYFF